MSDKWYILIGEFQDCISEIQLIKNKCPYSFQLFNKLQEALDFIWERRQVNQFQVCLDEDVLFHCCSIPDTDGQRKALIATLETINAVHRVDICSPNDDIMLRRQIHTHIKDWRLIGDFIKPSVLPFHICLKCMVCSYFQTSDFITRNEPHIAQTFIPNLNVLNEHMRYLIDECRHTLNTMSDERSNQPGQEE